MTKVNVYGPQPIRIGCKGCSALETEPWVYYEENDGVDRGTDAYCTLNGQRKMINRYWEADDRFPNWCPLESSASAHQGGYVSVIDVEKLLCSRLGREWSPTGISIESLVNDLSSKKKGHNVLYRH